MPKAVTAVSVALNITVLGLAAWAALGGAVWLVRKLVITPHHERLASQHALLEVQPGDTVFLGDSITEGGIWHELFPASATRQRGIGGDTTTGVLARLDPIAQAKPRQVFLLIGTNDLFFGVAQGEIVANVVQIVDRLHAASPQTSVFVQSVLPRAAKFQHRVESLNTALEKAVSGKATWINLYPLFLDPSRTAIDDGFSNDALHLLGKGYLVWRDAIEQHVAKR
jgi:lysophospholipase L1-like esterase